MNISLKTTGIMSDYLPADAVGGRATVSLADGANFGQLAEHLGIPAQEQYVVSINDTLQPEPAACLLQDGDLVIIMAPLAAG